MNEKQRQQNIDETFKRLRQCVHVSHSYGVTDKANHDYLIEFLGVQQEVLELMFERRDALKSIGITF